MERHAERKKAFSCARVDFTLVKYALVAKFFKNDLPLDSPFVPNSTKLSVTTLTPSFKIGIPIKDGDYSIDQAEIRIFANTDLDCCIERFPISFVNLKNPTFNAASAQPTCVNNVIVNGSVTLSNVVAGSRWKICYNPTFNCANCGTSDGQIVNGGAVIPVVAPAAGQNKQFVIRVYNGPSCISYKDYVGSHTAPSCDTSGVIVTPQAVLLNQYGGTNIYSYEPATQVKTTLGQTFSSADIAHTANKLFQATALYVNTQITLRIKEYNINLNPFSLAFSKDYDLPDATHNGPGLHAVSNTELYIANSHITQLIISGITITPTVLFNLPVLYNCTGDLIYDPATQLFLISYDNQNDYRIGVFQRSGTVVRSYPAPSKDIYGIYQFGGNTYLMGSAGKIYSLNLNTLVSTEVNTISLMLAGASQIQSNISIPS